MEKTTEKTMKAIFYDNLENVALICKSIQNKMKRASLTRNNKTQIQSLSRKS